MLQYLSVLFSFTVFYCNVSKADIKKHLFKGIIFLMYMQNKEVQVLNNLRVFLSFFFPYKLIYIGHKGF